MAEAQMNVVMTGSEFLTVFAAASTAPFHAEEGALAGSTKQHLRQS
ncbi:hypothetical protein [Sinorhizobium meliloti]|nr:hypothetical protein [Sinorhizobium meliloti]MDW9374075.1 hypothetical protein [Sinorhizobium meliloti]MDW9463455.1 hypothetical protein [Sinorhizobium meliloti]MDW9492597.1 hypothetical protein [Sinorhizobium meliloti]MDW9509100.1 hypothetical protein [Sinorhizobium meliloti]MDW9535756.1 hypothetical protein [Sinorhizobium meliloti]